MGNHSGRGETGDFSRSFFFLLQNISKRNEELMRRTR